MSFPFFHRVTNLSTHASGGTGATVADVAPLSIERVEMDVQARLKGGPDATCAPLDETGSWPSMPLYAQLERGVALAASGEYLSDYCSTWAPAEKITLQRGVDFDEVVLGIPVGALPYVAAELAAASPRFGAMISGSQTVATGAMQLWLDKTTAQLGFTATPRPVTLIGFAEPLDTWADMTHALGREDWPKSGGPKSLAYFCGPIKETRSRHRRCPMRSTLRARAAAKADFVAWLDARAGRLWPAVKSEAHGVWSVLHSTSGAVTTRRQRVTSLTQSSASTSALMSTLPPGTSSRRPARSAGRGCIRPARRSTICGSRATGHSTGSTRGAPKRRSPRACSSHARWPVSRATPRSRITSVRRVSRQPRPRLLDERRGARHAAHPSIQVDPYAIWPDICYLMRSTRRSDDDRRSHATRRPARFSRLGAGA